jgi:Arrestin (or S-antigen), C-terminal domain/Arrestin (or S-antigen), N-terminal domain
MLKDTKGQKLRPGKYQFPFDFALPSSLPASVKVSGSGRGGYNGRIYYHLRAQLGDLLVDRSFEVISAPLPSDIVPCLVEPTTHEVKAFGLLNKGFLSVGASVENSMVGRGQTLRVSLASRNDTSVDLTRVRVKLVELVEYRAFSEKATIKLDLEKLKDINLPGLHKSKVTKQQVRENIRCGFDHNKRAVYRSLYQDMVSRHNRFEIVVPKDARDSYDGNLITISHYLKITFFTNDSTTDNPSTKIPIIIGNASRRERQATRARPERLPNEPIATVISDDDFSDTATTVEVGSRAEFAPMADAYLFDSYNGATPELRPLGPNDTIFLDTPVFLDPSAPSESMILDHDMHRNYSIDEDSTIESDIASFRLPVVSRSRLGDFPSSPHRPITTGYIPQMYNTPAGGHGRRERLPSYSYDTESGITTLSDSPQRLGAAYPEAPSRNANSQWTFEGLLRELDGSIHDYEVVATKLRDPGYRELFAMLTPTEFRSVIGHVSMSHQVQVALLLAKQMVRNSSFTCAHCALALQKTSEFFRANMVESLLPYCNDLATNVRMIQQELNDWEQVITAKAFTVALGK